MHVPFLHEHTSHGLIDTPVSTNRLAISLPKNKQVAISLSMKLFVLVELFAKSSSGEVLMPCTMPISALVKAVINFLYTINTNQLKSKGIFSVKSQVLESWLVLVIVSILQVPTTVLLVMGIQHSRSFTLKWPP